MTPSTTRLEPRSAVRGTGPEISPGVRCLYCMPFARHAVSQVGMTVGEHPCWFDEKGGELIVHFCPKNRSPHTIFDLNFRTKDPNMHARIKGMFQELSRID